jgi:hypothetical protein
MEGLNPAPVKRVIEIPANVPEDVVDAVNNMLRDAVEADAEGGFIFHGFWSISHHSTMRGGGVLSPIIKMGMRSALEAGYRAYKKASGHVCQCEACCVERGEKPVDGAALLSESLKNRGGQA